MKINPFANVTFSSKRKQTRKADDILRNAKVNFPTLSTTYIDGYYSSMKEGGKHHKRVDKICNHIADKLLATRKNAAECLLIEKNIPESRFLSRVIKSLQYIKKIGIGNCGENCHIGIAALAANDIISFPTELKIETRFFDKETNKTIAHVECKQDHLFCISDVDNDGAFETIVDPWLGFTDSTQGAKARLKSAVDASECPEAKPYNFVALLNKFDQLYGYDGKLLENVGLEHSFSFVPSELGDFDIKTYKKFGDYIKKEYPELILEKEETEQNDFDIK